MNTSLLRRMILAQGLVLSLIWLVMIAFILLVAFGKLGVNAEDLPRKIQASTLLALLRDERDPVRFQTQAHRLQELAETYPQFSDSNSAQYRSIFQISDTEGHLLFRSDAAPQELLTPKRSGIFDLEKDGILYRVQAMEDPAAHLCVLVADPLEQRRREIVRAVLLQSPVQFSVLFLVLALCTWLVSRQALKPLRRLAEAVEARHPGDLSPLVGHADLLETRPLVTALNQLFHQVQTLLDTQRRFVADAAHELRTPLAVIAAQAHVLQNAQDPAQRQLAGRDLQVGVERGAQAIRQLLSVARLEAMEPSCLTSPMNLAALAQERVASLVPQALAKDQDLGYQGPENLKWEGDPIILGSALDNLLVNALLYTPPGGRITLRISAKDEEVRIEVEDTGPGIPVEFHERIFERFTRLPGTLEPGSGLGLAIVRRAVEWHRGTVTLSNLPTGSGLLATVRLPRELA